MNETIDLIEYKKEVEITDYLVADSEMQPSKAYEESSIEEKAAEDK